MLYFFKKEPIIFGMVYNLRGRGLIPGTETVVISGIVIPEI